MNDQLQGKLVEILSGIQGAVGKASDFALTQLPDVAQSYVVYGRAENTLYIALAAIMFISAALLCRLFLIGVDEDNYNKSMPGFFGGLVSFIIFMAVFFSNIGSFLMVWFAPKVWLLKELAHFLK